MIKSIDMKIIAEGSGVVNWNGSFPIFNKLAGSNGQVVNNHQLPKMRGIDPFTLKSLTDEQLKNATLIISQNCIRHEIFRNESSGLKTVDLNNLEDVICSILGLVRGYVIADDQTKLSIKRKSSLLLEDFEECSNSVGGFEQFSNSGERNETSIFSKHNYGKTKYEAYASINIEDLQFIVLEDSFGRSSYKDIITIEEGEKLASKLTDYLKQLDFDGKKNPLATFNKNYVRIGAIMKTGEAGLLLNDDAITLIINVLIDRIKNLFINQSKGYVKVTSITIDYNDASPMRIKYNESLINNHNNEKYFVYYKGIDLNDDDFNKKMKSINENKKKQKENKLKDTSKKDKDVNNNLD